MSDRDEQVWYELEYSRAGDDDWYAASPDSGHTADTLEAMQRILARQPKVAAGFEYRAVKKTLTTEVLP